MKKAFLLCVLCVAATKPQPKKNQPATLPTTYPATADVMQAKHQRDAAQTAFDATSAAVVDARKNAENKFAKTSEAIVVAGDVERARIAREKATDTQTKMSTGSAWNQLRTKLEDMQHKAVAADPQFADAQTAYNTSATKLKTANDAFTSTVDKAIADAARAQADADARDPIKTAIRNCELVVGMTMSQAGQAMVRDYNPALKPPPAGEEQRWAVFGRSRNVHENPVPELRYKADGIETWVWAFMRQSAIEGETPRPDFEWHADFKDGVIVKCLRD